MGVKNGKDLTLYRYNQNNMAYGNHDKRGNRKRL